MSARPRLTSLSSRSRSVDTGTRLKPGCSSTVVGGVAPFQATPPGMAGHAQALGGLLLPVLPLVGLRVVVAGVVELLVFCSSVLDWQGGDNILAMNPGIFLGAESEGRAFTSSGVNSGASFSSDTG